MVYRENEYVEGSPLRCFCDAPAAVTCDCCRRYRCRAHIEGRLCNRCTQAVEREAPRLSSTAWTIGGAAGVVIAVALLVAAGPVGIFAGLAGGVVAGGVSYRGLRRRLVNTLRPRLASTVGELEPPARGPDEIDGTLGGPNNRPPGGFGPGV